jgi:hypothetical protein
MCKAVSIGRDGLFLWNEMLKTGFYVLSFNGLKIKLYRIE